MPSVVASVKPTSIEMASEKTLAKTLAAPFTAQSHGLCSSAKLDMPSCHAGSYPRAEQKARQDDGRRVARMPEVEDEALHPRHLDEHEAEPDTEEIRASVPELWRPLHPPAECERREE